MTEEKGFNDWLAEIATNTAVTRDLMSELVDMARAEAFASKQAAPDYVPPGVAGETPSGRQRGPLIDRVDEPEKSTQFALTKAYEVEVGSAMLVEDHWERIQEVDADGSTITLTTHDGTIRVHSREEFVPLVSEFGEAQ